MADYAELVCEVRCPACGEQSEVSGGVVRFQWGKVPHHYAAPGPVEWIRDASGAVEPSFDLGDESELEAWNAGDPAEGEAIVLDPEAVGARCSRCGAKFEALGVEISGGKLVGAVAYLEGVLGQLVAAQPGSYSALVRRNWVWRPFPDWEQREQNATIVEDV